MITLMNEIPKRTDNADFCFARICCNFEAYGNYPNIALFFKQTENGVDTAYFSLFGDCLTVFYKGGNLSEIKSFIKMQAPNFVLMKAELAEKLRLDAIETNTAFLKIKDREILLPENTLEGVRVLAERLSRNFKNTNKDEMYVDLSHLARHNCLNYVTTPISAAAMQTSENYGIITGICVEKEKRNLSIGSALLAKLVKRARGKRIYALAKSNLEKFYTSNGFIDDGKYSLCKGK